jgi:YD repeat-containing protein
MRKIYITLLILVCIPKISAQGIEEVIKTDLPTVFPPSPTVAALMKFEETPVNNYTGIPDISIPLFSTGTLSKDINLDISLKYHPGGVSADEKASDVGLGWSLFAGGTISRTVNGLPDELLRFPYNPIKAQIGIYQNLSTLTSFPNRYDEYIYVRDTIGSGVNNAQRDLIREYLFESHEKGKYDHEHDIWQFNFLGHSGSFFIKKNVISGILEVKPLDNYTEKIINVYGNSSNPYEPTGFIIYDDKGYKYKFDIIEVTTTYTHVSKNVAGLPIIESISNGFIYNSSFHLSEIRDNNDKLIVSLNYSSLIAKENALDKSTVHNYADLHELHPEECEEQMNHNLEPTNSYTNSRRDTSVKKLDLIEVIGMAKIKFKYGLGREDSNYYYAADSSYVFKGLTIMRWNNDSIKRIKLEHFYSTTIDTRLMLGKVKFQNFQNSKEEIYQLEYRLNNNPFGEEYINKDLWGYFKIPNSVVDFGRDTNPNFCTTELLQKMTLPSGGCVIFDFEPNTFSVSNPDENPLNWDNTSSDKIFEVQDLNHNPYFELVVGDTQDVKFTSEVITTETNVFRDYYYRVYKVESGGETLRDDLNLSCINCGTYNSTFILPQLAEGTYRFRLVSVDTSFDNVLTTATLTAFYKVRNSNNYEYSFGGGNRIHKIGYFESDVDKGEYQFMMGTPPQKEKIYKYNFFGSPLTSSGALAGPKPIYNYPISKRPCLECTYQMDTNKYTYDVTTSYNNVTLIKTAGADIGYQNVTVYETGNGTTEYIYTSPNDFPFSGPAVPGYPFIMEHDDQEPYRGHLLSEKVKDESEKILLEKNYEYEYEIHTQRTGFKTMYYNEHTDCPISRRYNTYAEYKSYVNHCAQNMSNNDDYTPVSECPSCDTGPYGEYACIIYIDPDHSIFLDDCPCWCYCGAPDAFIASLSYFDTYGWAKLKTKTTKEYFYPNGGSTSNIVQTDETYKYNSVNKKIRETAVTNSKGDLLRTKYFYHSGDAPGHQNRISEIERIETYKDSTLLSTSKIVYDNAFSGNASYLPKTIQTAKDTQALENRVRYESYDEYGHPLEVQSEKGTPISYIWGYNKSQPIAKIENASNAQIATALGVSLSTVDESDMAAINSLRATLDNAMVTTYTYIPLVGVSTITDPRGYTTTYEYDSFGRLSTVKDADGKILTENEYNYRTQN